MRRLTAFDRIYAAAMLIFPRAFRSRFGREMRDMAQDRMAEARLRGRAAAFIESTRLLADIAATAPSAWTILRRERTSYVAPATVPYPRDHMDVLTQDLRFAFRGLLRRPAFTIVAVLTLALGIGATTAIFSVVNAVLIRALPYPDPDRLVMLWSVQGSQHGQPVAYLDYHDWRARTHSFVDMGVMRGQSLNLTGGDAPDRVTGSFVSASLFRVTGTKMARGRSFTDAETELASKAPVAIVQYETWRTRFAGDSSLVGKSLILNGTAFTVVGVTAPNSQIPYGAADVYLPMPYYPNAHGFDRGVTSAYAVGRLKPGVTLEAATRDIAAVAKQIEAAYPETNRGVSAEVESVKEALVGRVRDSLYIMLGAVGLVLLIACANIANLQLARSASRSRELSVRAALGAGRGRIVQQLLTESVVLSVVGGIAGIGIALALTKLLVTLVGGALPVEPTDIRLDGPVLLFALGVSVATGLLFGVAPALQASRADLNDTLRSRVATFASRRTRNLLVVVQLALSLALLACAGLLTRSLIALQGVDPGFDGRNLLTAQFRLPAAKYDTPEKIATMFAQTAAELRSIPGVQAAALVRASPFSQNGESYPVSAEGKPETFATDAPSMLLNAVTPGYFSTMRIPVLAGRDIGETDRADAALVIVVNKSYAEETWPGEPAIGKRVKVGGDGWRTVVGVVGDAKHYTLNEHQLLQGYVPHAQRPQIFTSIVVRTIGNPLALSKAVREAIWRVDRDQPVWRFRAMEQDLSAVVQTKRAMMLLTGLFATAALIVAVVGVYGVLSYTMTQRTQEVGIRIALGADGRAVTRMVVGEGARIIGIAVVIGLAISAGATRLLRSQLFGIQPNDLTTFAIVTVALSTVAIAACYLPARRASRVDPMVALRSD